MKVAIESYNNVLLDIPEEHLAIILPMLMDAETLDYTYSKEGKKVFVPTGKKTEIILLREEQIVNGDSDEESI